MLKTLRSWRLVESRCRSFCLSLELCAGLLQRTKHL